jgi:hypothetical protein
MLDEGHSVADESASGAGGPPGSPAESLPRAIERHLFEAVLTRRQRITWRRHGWFELLWPEQLLVLRVHAPHPAGAAGPTPTTVDAFQMSAWSAPGRCGADPPADTYLVSWDLAGAFARGALAAGPATFRCPAPTPLAIARLICEAHRRGALRHLLEAGRTLRLATPETPGPPRAPGTSGALRPARGRTGPADSAP